MAFDPQTAVSFDLKYPSAPLIVSFAGIQSGLGLSHFEFIRVLQPFQANKIFIRDPFQSWYQRGVSDQIRSTTALTQFLQQTLQKLQPSKVIFTGNSMGGFAAILFAALAGADEVIAFSPQTFVSATRRMLHLDYRWPRQIFRVRRGSRVDRHTDLRPVLRKSNAKPKITIHYAARHRLDRAHATHIACFGNVRLVPSDSAAHNVVRSLRDSGRLHSILSEALYATPLSDAA